MARGFLFPWRGRGRGAKPAPAPRGMACPSGLPAGTDWFWRPDLISAALQPDQLDAGHPGAPMGGSSHLWYDDTASPPHALQSPQADADGAAPYFLTIRFDGFTGSYLALSCDLPQDVMQGMSQANILRLETILSAPDEVVIYARLNVRHGPNTEEMLRRIDRQAAQDGARLVVEFDLAGTDLNPRRLDKLWLDLIVEKPRNGGLEISELILSRHLRANF